MRWTSSGSAMAPGWYSPQPEFLRGRSTYSQRSPSQVCERDRMFQMRYVASELRRRLGRTLLTALGLAAGVGLVIGIVGVSQGLADAQSKVLAPLRSVGTDILVTRVAGATTVSSTSGSTATTVTTEPADNGPGGGGQGGGGLFFGGAGGGGRNGGGANSLANLNDADAQALLQENESVITDLSKLGQPGD